MVAAAQPWHRTPSLRSAPRLCQADADPGLAHADAIQEKGFQTLKCNRYKDRPNERAPSCAARLAAEQSLLETAARAGDAQDPTAHGHGTRPRRWQP